MWREWLGGAAVLLATGLLIYVLIAIFAWVFRWLELWLAERRFQQQRREIEAQRHAALERYRRQ